MAGSGCRFSSDGWRGVTEKLGDAAYFMESIKVAADRLRVDADASFVTRGTIHARNMWSHGHLVRKSTGALTLINLAPQVFDWGNNIAGKALRLVQLARIAYAAKEEAVMQLLRFFDDDQGLPATAAAWGEAPFLAAGEGICEREVAQIEPTSKAV